MLKKGIAMLLALLLLCPAVNALAVAARLNREMATRSGPGTWYTEELGTFPATTAVTAIEQITTSETTWVMVEFRDGGKLYRAYTGLGRLQVYGEVPQASAKGYADTVTVETAAYYGPGLEYATRRTRVYAGTGVTVFDQEGSWALCEYRENGAMVRGYIAVSALRDTPGIQQASLPSATPAVATQNYWGSMIPSSQVTNMGVDYYGNAYDFTGTTEAFASLVRSLPVMQYFEGIPCVQRSDVYSGPDDSYYRPYTSAGYAYTSTADANLRVYGKENDWLLIRYPVATGYRYGWTVSSAIPSNLLYWARDFEHAQVKVVSSADTYTTHDPDTLGAQTLAVPQGIYMTALAFLDDSRAWVYCEFTVLENGAYYACRGFVPAHAIKPL